MAKHLKQRCPFTGGCKDCDPETVLIGGEDTTQGGFFPAQPTDPDYEKRRAALIERLQRPIGKAHTPEPNPFSEEYPLVCFESDLDAALAAGKELNARGFAQMPDGYWMMSAAQVAKIQAHLKGITKTLSTSAPNPDAPRHTIESHLRIAEAFQKLVALLPGGDR